MNLFIKKALASLWYVCFPHCKRPPYVHQRILYLHQQTLYLHTGALSIYPQGRCPALQGCADKVNTSINIKVQ